MTRKSARQRARDAAHSKRRRALIRPDAFKFPRNKVDKTSFTQIRTDFDLKELASTTAASSAVKSDILGLEVLQADAHNSYIPWDGS